MRLVKKYVMLLCVLAAVFCMPQHAHAAGMQVSANAVSSSKIQIKWNAVDGASDYAVYRRASSESSLKKIQTISGLTYKDTAVRTGTTYYYKVVPISVETGKEMDGISAEVKAKAPRKVSISRIKAASSSKLQIFWTESAGSTGYQIYRSEGKGGRYTEVGRVDGKNTCTFIDKKIVPGKIYYYKVRPTNQKHEGVGSFSSAVKGRTLAKSAVTSISSVASDRMQITWKKVSGAQTYELYRSTSAKGKYRKIAVLKSNNRKFLDKTVKSGRRYYYKVVAAGVFNGERITSGSSEAVAFRALQKVKISSVKATADDKMRIKWGKVTSATKYKIYRSTSKNGVYKQIAIVPQGSSATLSYIDSKISPGKSYFYKVQAYSEEKGVISAGSGSKSDAKGASTDYAIMGKTTVTKEQMVALYNASGKPYPSHIYKDKGAKNIAKFCEIVIEESKAEGVRAEVIFAQVCLETGYLQFYGQVSATQCNFSGLGATDDGAAGATFKDVRTGIRAQVQHLKGYASKESLNQACVDPRFQYLSYRRGTAPHVQDLGGGNWATDPDYASKLMRLIKAMKSY